MIRGEGPLDVGTARRRNRYNTRTFTPCCCKSQVCNALHMSMQYTYAIGRTCKRCARVPATALPERDTGSNIAPSTTANSTHHPVFSLLSILSVHSSFCLTIRIAEMWAFLFWTVLIAWGTSIWVRRNVPVNVLREQHPLIAFILGVDLETNRHVRASTKDHSATDVAPPRMDEEPMSGLWSGTEQVSSSSSIPTGRPGDPVRISSSLVTESRHLRDTTSETHHPILIQFRTKVLKYLPLVKSQDPTPEYASIVDWSSSDLMS